MNRPLLCLLCSLAALSLAGCIHQRCEHTHVRYCDAEGCTDWPITVCKAVAPEPTLFGKH